MEEPINLKDYVKKTEVAKKISERIKQETFYTYIGIGAPLITYIAIVLGGVWTGIVPIGAVGVLYYLRLIKLKQATAYLKENYEQKLKNEPKEEFI